MKQEFCNWLIQNSKYMDNSPSMATKSYLPINIISNGIEDFKREKLKIFGER